jgi:hypothetical protein
MIQVARNAQLRPHDYLYSNSPPLDSPRPRLKDRGSKIPSKVQVLWNEENTLSKFFIDHIYLSI